MGDLPLVLSQNSNIAFPKRCRKRDEIIWEQNNYCAAPQTCDLYHEISSAGSALPQRGSEDVKLEGFSLRYGRLRKNLRWLEAVCFHGYRQVRRYPSSFKITLDYTEKETPNSMGVGSQCTRYKHMLLIGRPIWHSVRTPIRSCQ